MRGRTTVRVSIDYSMEELCYKKWSQIGQPDYNMKVYTYTGTYNPATGFKWSRRLPQVWPW